MQAVLEAKTRLLCENTSEPKLDDKLIEGYLYLKGDIDTCLKVRNIVNETFLINHQWIPYNEEKAEKQEKARKIILSTILCVYGINKQIFSMEKFKINFEEKDESFPYIRVFFGKLVYFADEINFCDVAHLFTEFCSMKSDSFVTEMEFKSDKYQSLIHSIKRVYDILNQNYDEIHGQIDEKAREEIKKFDKWIPRISSDRKMNPLAVIYSS